MPKLIVGNFDVESMIHPRAFADVTSGQSSAAAAARVLWYAQPGDVVVLPIDPPKDLVVHTAEVLGFSPEDITILVPPPFNGRTAVPLWAERLLAPEIVDQLKGRVTGDWTVLPYFFDRNIVKLCDTFGMAVPNAYIREGGAEWMNSKIYFRKMMTRESLPIAPGRIVRKEQLAEAIAELVVHTNRAMIKVDVHAGGLGNTVVSPDKNARSDGANRFEHFSDTKALRDLCENLYADNTLAADEDVIVEAHLDAELVCGVEYECFGPDGGPSRFLNVSTYRMTPLISAMEFPGNMTADVRAEMVRQAGLVANASAKAGYIGRVNIDALLTPKGPVFCEFNGRLGGQSHGHDVASRLLGPDYLQKYHVNWVCKVPFPTVTIAKERLKGLEFDPKRGDGTGVLVLGHTPVAGGAIECLVIAPDAEKLAATEAKIWELVGAS